MSLQAIDIDEGGAKYLPFAQHMLRRLKVVLDGIGLSHGRKTYRTPDGGGMVYIRTRRGQSLVEKNAYIAGKSVSIAPSAYAPDDRIDEWYDYIRIEVNIPSAFIFTPYVRNVSSGTPYDLGTNIAIKIPFQGNAKPFPNLGQGARVYPIELPHSTNKVNDSNIVTGMTNWGVRYFSLPSPTDTQAVVSAIDNQTPVTGFIDFSGDTVGIFKHVYTQDEVEHTVLLKLFKDGVIRNFQTNAVIAAGGDAITGTGFCTWVADKNGRNLVLDFPGGATTRYLLTIDLSLATPINRTAITLSNGSTLLDETNSHTVTTASGIDTGTKAITYTGNYVSTGVVARGVDIDGGLVEINLNRIGTFSGSSLLTNSGNGELPPAGSTWGASVPRSGSYTLDTTKVINSIFELPGIGAKSIETYSQHITINNSSNLSYQGIFSLGETSYRVSGGSASGTQVTVTKTGTPPNIIRRIYADPSIPFMLYSRLYVVSTETISASHSWVLSNPSDPNSSVVQSGGSTTVTESKSVFELVVLYGDKERVLYTQESPISINSVASGEISNYAATITWDESPGETDNSVSFAAQNSNASGRLRFVSPSDVNISIIVSAKSKNDWIVGITLSPTTPFTWGNEFYMYAGKLNEAKLRERYLTYVVNALAPVNAAASLAIASENFTDYQIKLSHANTGSYI